MKTARATILSLMGLVAGSGYCAEVRVSDAESARKAVRDAKPGVQSREGRPAVRVKRAPEAIVWKGNAFHGEWIGMERGDGVRETHPGDLALPALPAIDSFGASWMRAAGGR